MEKLTNCPVCSSGLIKSYLDCIDYTVSHETFQIVQCEECGFRFTNPRPDEKEIGRYYQSEEYVSHSGTGRGVVNKLYGLVRSFTIRRKVRLINRLMPNTNPAALSLLDFGCGTGEFMNACKKAGWNVTGIEPSDIARKHAKEQFGIDPMVPDEIFNIGGIFFNVITLWHVLEHVHRLHRTVEKLNEILVDNGILVVAVPNPDSWDAKKYGEHWAAWDLPRHLYHFRRQDIEKLFSMFGFAVKEVLPMKFDSYYVSLLSEKYKSGHTSLRPGLINGLRSNMNALTMGHGYSSQIYILNKKLIS